MSEPIKATIVSADVLDVGGTIYVRRRTAAPIVVADEDTDGATGYCICGACGKAIDPWDCWCRHCGCEVTR